MRLTNLQICSRIAEIEGAVETFNSVSKPTSLTAIFKNRTSFGYNPLTDDALLNQLIFKYEISINFNFCTLNMVRGKFFEMNFTDIPSLKRNILLLIIEAHKEQS